MVNFLTKAQPQSPIEKYFNFQPDLIIEVTDACDRSCSGCYASNVLISKKTNSSMARFLRPEVLTSSLTSLGQIEMLCIRGGEPSVHPQIDKLLEVSCKFAHLVALETHGQWIEPGHDLLETCRKNNIFIKISFDSMHGLSPEQLFEKHMLLKTAGINHLVAITELSFEKFKKSRDLCSWFSDEQIIFQKKARSLEELIKPKLGVINVDGALNGTLSTKESFSMLKLNA